MGILSPVELRGVLFAPGETVSPRITGTFKRLRSDFPHLGQEYFEVLRDFAKDPAAFRHKLHTYDEVVGALVGFPQLAGDPGLERRVLSSALIQGIYPREAGIQQFSTPGHSATLAATLEAEMVRQPLLQSYLRGRSGRLLEPDPATLQAVGHRTGERILEAFRSEAQMNESHALLMAAGKLGLLGTENPRHGEWAAATAEKLRRPHPGPVAAYLLGARDGRIPGIGEPDGALLSSAPVKEVLLGGRGTEVFGSVRSQYGHSFPVSTSLLRMARSDAAFLPVLGRELVHANVEEIPDALNLIRSKLPEGEARTLLRPAFASRSVVAAQAAQWPELLAAEFPDIADRRLLRDPALLRSAFSSVKGQAEAARENFLLERLKGFPPGSGLIEAGMQGALLEAVEDGLKTSRLKLWEARTGEYLGLLHRSRAGSDEVSRSLAEFFRFDESRTHQATHSDPRVLRRNMELALAQLLTAAEEGKLPEEIPLLLAQETRTHANPYRAGRYTRQDTLFGSRILQHDGPLLEGWIRILGRSQGGPDAERALSFLLEQFTGSQSRWARTYLHPQEFSEAEARALLSAIDKLPRPSAEFSKEVAKSLGNVAVLRAALEYAPALVDRYPPLLAPAAIEALEGLADGRVGGLRDVVHLTGERSPTLGGVKTFSATEGAGADALAEWVRKITEGMRLAPVVEGGFPGGAPAGQVRIPQAGVPDIQNPIYRARVQGGNLEGLRTDLGVLFRKSVERSLKDAPEGVEEERIRNLAARLRMPFLGTPGIRPNPGRASLRIEGICREGFARLGGQRPR